MTSARSRSHARILLVDDNHHGNSARKSVLQEHGYQVECALSGEQGLNMFLGAPFDVVVTDLKMEKMSGLDLIAHIRKSGRAALVILLSGWAGCLGITEESSGADAVLCKSNHEQDQLLRTVRLLLARRTRRKPAASSVARSG